MSSRIITTAERRSRLARRHRLLAEERCDDVATVVDDVLALHSSDPATVHLSAWARMANPSRTAVEDALYEQRSLVRHHVMRRTLWVAGREEMALMNATSGRRVHADEHRKTLAMLANNGIADPQAWFDEAAAEVLSVVHEQGPVTTRRIGDVLPHLRTKLESTPGNPKTAMISTHSRLLVDLGFAARVVRTRPSGDWHTSAYAWSATDRWLGADLPTLDREESAARLVDHWLRRFGPGTTTDLQWWLGWTKTQTRAALTAADAEPVELEDGPEPGWVAADDLDPEPDAGEWIAVLPSLDATTMGWKQRDWYLPDHAGDAFDRYGNAGATIWVDGRVVGAWTQTKEGDLRHLWFESVPVRRRRQVERRLDEVRDWLGTTVVTERFPGLSRTTLLAQS